MHQHIFQLRHSVFFLWEYIFCDVTINVESQEIYKINVRWYSKFFWKTTYSWIHFFFFKSPITFFCPSFTRRIGNAGLARPYHQYFHTMHSCFDHFFSIFSRSTDHRCILHLFYGFWRKMTKVFTMLYFFLNNFESF